ncbi:MAG: metallophosphoesterase family protein [Bacteroidetes bacterium]|nr:metallophosphoesterase family protein [Bacteroidota bacterium]
MKKIALLSDTHGYLDSVIPKYLESVDEIWHAGDIGSLQVTDELQKIKPVKAVYGNIDGQDVRRVHPLHQRFLCEEVDVWITHIGGYPGHYAPAIKQQIQLQPPQLFICGHSHILKVVFDKKLNVLHMNPGACGNHGFHKVKTLLRFTIHGTKISDLEIIELGNRA